MSGPANSLSVPPRMSPQSDERRSILGIYREVWHDYYRNEQEATHQGLQIAGSAYNQTDTESSSRLERELAEH